MNETSDQKKSEWYENKALVVVLLVVFFPVGLYAIWKNTEFSDKTKWIVTGIIAFLVLVIGVSDKKPEPRAVQVATTPSSSNDSASGDTIKSEKHMAQKKTNSDSAGVEKNWGNIGVTLKDYRFFGSSFNTVLVMRNNSSKEEKISSIMQMEALTDEGDKGEFQLMDSSCDGAIPPNGAFKCKLTYKFPESPKKVSLRIGAGVLTDALYFNIVNK